MFEGWDTASIGGVSVAGHCDEEGAEDLNMAGTMPVFRATREALAGLSPPAGVNTIIDTITTQTGRVVGPWRVAVWRPQDDGEIVNMQLEAQ